MPATATATATDPRNGTGETQSEATPIASACGARDYASISPTASASASQAQDTLSTSRAVDAATTTTQSGTQKRTRGRWAQAWEKWGSVELENKGSVARDHLALERTFLAWLRTSLSFASIGIAITQLFRLNSSLRSDTSATSPSSPSSFSPSSSFSSTTSSTSKIHRLRHLGKPLGATFLAIAILMLAIGFHRYFEAQHYIIRGKFPASRGSVVVVSVLAGGLIVVSLGVILGTGEGVSES